MFYKKYNSSPHSLLYELVVARRTLAIFSCDVLVINIIFTIEKA